MATMLGTRELMTEDLNVEETDFSHILVKQIFFKIFKPSAHTPLQHESIFFQQLKQFWKHTYPT